MYRKIKIFQDIYLYNYYENNIFISDYTETKFGVTGDFQEDGDITENMIRQEHNLNLRANYDSNKIFDNFSIEEEKQREKRIKQLLKEMERGK